MAKASESNTTRRALLSAGLSAAAAAKQVEKAMHDT